MATKTTAKVTTVPVQTFYPRIEKSIPAEVQRHLQLIYSKLNNHAVAFQRVAASAAAATAGQETIGTPASGSQTGVFAAGMVDGVGTVNNQRLGLRALLAAVPPPAVPYKIVTANYSIAAGDYQIEAAASFLTITLPTAAGIAGIRYSIKNTSNGTITVATTSAQTIDGAVAQTLAQWDNLTVMSNGSNWIIV